MLKKFLIISLFLTGSIILIGWIFEKDVHPQQIYGVSFSPNYAAYLGLDWQKTYLGILESGVKNLRIVTFWDFVEEKMGQYDFSKIDFMVSEANKKEAKIILVLGLRQPRWPECHIPAWAKNLNLEERQQQSLQFVTKVVERYKNDGIIWAWQVENEPLVSWFGEACPAPDKKFLIEEIKLVKSLDIKRPVVITDSGEWSSWMDAYAAGDILGISLYKKAYNTYFNAYIKFPIPAWMYTLKANLVRKLVGKDKKIIITELQAEPWLKDGVLGKKAKEQTEFFSVAEFEDYINFAKQTGFDTIYLWGVEWWYFMAQNGYPEYLQYAKSLFSE